MCRQNGSPLTSPPLQRWVADQHPQVDVASPVGLAASDAAVQNDGEYVVEFVDQRFGGGGRRFVGLRLRDLKSRLVRERQPLAIDLHQPARSRSLLDDEVLTREPIHGFRDRRPREIDRLRDFRDRERFVVVPT